MRRTTTDGQAEAETPAPSALVVRRLDALTDIERRQPDMGEIWYSHSILTSTLFPANPPKEGTDFVSKRNGTVEYFLEPGIDTVTRTRGFPFGKYPRLIMAWMAKQIRAADGHRTDTVIPDRRVIVIPSINRLCDDMGVGHGGTTQRSVGTQLRRLLASHISVRRTADPSAGFVGRRRLHEVQMVPLVEKIIDMDDMDDAGQSAIAFQLSRDVWERLASESAPFDTRATKVLLSGRSVMPYDVYVWLTGSMRTLTHPMSLDWGWLMERFGEGFEEERNFRQAFRKAVRKVMEVYPGVRLKVDRHGVRLFPSPTAIAPRKGAGR